MIRERRGVGEGGKMMRMVVEPSGLNCICGPQTDGAGKGSSNLEVLLS